jgi:hypothetical protein
MHSLLILMTFVGLIFAPGARRVVFHTLSGVFGLIACVLAVVWAVGTGSGRRLW